MANCIIMSFPSSLVFVELAALACSSAFRLRETLSQDSVLKAALFSAKEKSLPFRYSR